MPEGPLTPAQYEILELIWDSGDTGASVAEIWQAVAARRSVGRTTVLTLVDRLEKRGWLAREEVAGVNRFQATVPRERTRAGLARDFIDGFFGGSTSSLVVSLLGNAKLTPREVADLRSLLDAAQTQRKPGKTLRKDDS